MQDQGAGAGMVTGTQGVKYGLQLRGPAMAAGGRGSASARPLGPAARGRGGGGAATAPMRKGSVFGEDSDEEEDVEAQVARQAETKRAAAKVAAVYEEALAEDASIFDYDRVYDALQQQKVQPRQQEKIERKSRYIAQLKEQAEERKRESDVAFERKQLKDRVKEDHLFQDKEVFVTGAYKRKLEEQQRWQEEQKRKEEEEAKQDVRKVGHMGNFYANLITKNVAFGTATSSKPGQEGTAPKASSSLPATTAATSPVSKEVSQAALVAAAAKAGVQLDKYELLRLEAERARVANKEGKTMAVGADASAAGGEEAAGEEGREGGAAAHATAGVKDDGGKGAEAAANAAVATAGEVQSLAAASAVAALAAGKRRNDDMSVQSARERYLARKKQHTS